MSRIIIKNLPKTITEKELHSIFGQKGTITDCSLKYTATGNFRGFAFIGYKDELNAKEAIKFFNNNYIKSNKVQVSLSFDLKSNRIHVYKTKLKNKMKLTSGNRSIWCIQMSNLHNEISKTVIEEFFKPIIVIIDEDLLKVSRGKLVVFFNNEKDKIEALRRNKSYMGSKKIFLKDIKNVVDTVFQKEIAETLPNLEEDIKLISETGRLFVRNLPYCCEEADLKNLFSKYGELSIQLPIDKLTNKLKGFAIISYILSENAIEAFKNLDGSIFQGRMLHIVGGHPEKSEQEDLDDLPFLKKKNKLKKISASNSHNWNTLFVGGDAVANLMAEKYSTSKKDLLLEDGKQSTAVRLALGQTQIVQEIKEFLLENGVILETFSQMKQECSKTVIIAKHLPLHTSMEQLDDLFKKYGEIKRIILPPSSLTALIEFLHPDEANIAFKSLAYTKFEHLPLYLEWAPENVFSNVPVKLKALDDEDIKNEVGCDEYDDFDLNEPRRTIFLSKLPDNITQDELNKVFSKYGKIIGINIKWNTSNGMTSAFVEYGLASSAQQCLKNSTNIRFNDMMPIVKISDRLTKESLKSIGKKKKKTKKEFKPTKLLVRNVPFQATIKDIKQLFSIDASLKTVRLPKKSNVGVGTHRGFAFVEFNLPSDAKRSYERLRHNTSLYGRRLNLEWVAPSDDNEGIIKDGRKRTAHKYHPDESINKKNKLEL